MSLKLRESTAGEIAAPDMLLHYPLHEPRRGRGDIKAFMAASREALLISTMRARGDGLAPEVC